MFASDSDEDLLRARADGGERDSLELYFDCRAQDSMRKGGYGPGCAVVRLTPDLNGGGTLEPKIGGGLDFSGARIVSNRTESGYRLEARIPLHGLKLAAGQKAMGFDVGQRSVDAEGKLDLHLLWAGGDRNARQTRGFGLLCLQ